LPGPVQRSLIARREAERTARARAESLAAEAERRSGAESARAELRTALESLVGVLPDVLSVRASDRGLEVVLGGGLFSSGSARLAGPAQTAVERVGSVLRRIPETLLLVEGHTDAIGDARANLTLSNARAESLRAALVSAGVAPTRIATVGRGQDFPLADNSTPAGRAQNRRVVIVLLGF
jgi:outer membrane protein OmpA-like peptidoglycan-associated protein